MIGIGSEGVEGLFEGDFDFESEAIDSKDIQGRQGQVGGHEDFGSMVRMDDQDKADEHTHGAPKQIDGAIPDCEMGFPRGWAGGLGEGGKVLEERFEFDFCAVFSFRTSSFLGVGRGRPISDRILTHLSDQVDPPVEQAQNDHFAGVIGVQSKIGWHGNGQGVDQVDHFIQQALGLPV